MYSTFLAEVQDCIWFFVRTSWCIHVFAQVEEKVRRAEEDKAMALTALEEREREFLQEKDTVRRTTGAVWRGG